MADFIAIVVPLASPIQPVATSKHDTEYTGVQNLMMVRVDLGVNRSIEEYATPSSGVCYPHAAQAGEHQSAQTAW